MNSEGLEDRYYFSDWGGCICPEDGIDMDCPLFDDSGLHEGSEEEED